MKQLVSILIIIFCYTTGFSQTGEPVPDNLYGKNGTKTTTKSINPTTQEEEVIIAYRDDEDRLCERITWRKRADGTYVRVCEVFNIHGTTLCKTTDLLNEKGELTGSYIETYNADGRVHNTGPNVRFSNENKRIEDELKEIQKGKAPAAPVRPSCRPEGNCLPPFYLFIGYSPLISLPGNNNESFPLGAHACFIYNASPRVGAGVDVSFHTKKVNEETLSRVFILGRGQYTLRNVKNCDHTLIPHLQVVAGLCTEKYGSSSGSAFAFGGGGGLDIKIARRLALKAEFDLLFAQFIEDAELDKNFRASTGLVINFGSGQTSSSTR